MSCAAATARRLLACLVPIALALPSGATITVAQSVGDAVGTAGFDLNEDGFADPSEVDSKHLTGADVTEKAAIKDVIPRDL